MSRTIVTSLRGDSVDSTWPAGTPNVESLKYFGMSAAFSPGVAYLRLAYIGSWSQQCGTVVPLASNAASSQRVVAPTRA